jgi:peptidoglycan L-alanyl-D-glutamate endopeptidase CwlK
VNGTAARLNFIYLISKLVIEARVNNIQIMPFNFFLSAEEVHKYFLEGKSQVDGYVKKAKHQFWQAMDLVIIKDGRPVWDRIPEYELLGQIWESMGGVWGGRWKSLNDIYHFEI